MFLTGNNSSNYKGPARIFPSGNTGKIFFLPTASPCNKYSDMSLGTGAGKGALPRHVDGEAYRSNFDFAFRKQKEFTFAELLKMHDAAVEAGKFDEAAEYKQKIELLNENTIQ